MKKIAISVLVMLGLAGAAAAQDAPGFALGGFYETRIDNRVQDENLTFDYYGGRIQFRDERWYSVYADLGAQSAEWNDYEADASGFFGVGGTLWLVRAEDLMVPLDIGIAGSFHRGELDFDPPQAGQSREATYSTWTAQAVLRSTGHGPASPFLRAGIRRSDMDIDGRDADDDDWEVYNPAVNVGVEFMPFDQFVVTVEGNYSEGVGFGIHADLWF